MNTFLNRLSSTAVLIAVIIVTGNILSANGDHTVQRRTGTHVIKQGEQDAQQVEQVNPKDSGQVQHGGQTMWLIETLTFRPPNPHEFLEFDWPAPPNLIQAV